MIYRTQDLAQCTGTATLTPPYISEEESEEDLLEYYRWQRREAQKK